MKISRKQLNQFKKKVTFDDQCIQIIPTPTRFIRQGIKAVMESEDKNVDKFALCDILPGKDKYSLPPGKVLNVFLV